MRRGDVAATTVETRRGDAAATTWVFRGAQVARPRYATSVLNVVCVDGTTDYGDDLIGAAIVAAAATDDGDDAAVVFEDCASVCAGLDCASPATCAVAADLGCACAGCLSCGNASNASATIAPS